MKYVEEIKTWIRHNYGITGGLIICVMLLIYSGCAVKTESPFSGEKVTKAELEAEVQAYVVKVQQAYDDLEQQEAIRKALLEAGLAYAQSGGVDFVGLGFTLAGICGIGLGVDNVRKDSVIKSKSTALEALTAKTEA